MIEKRPFRKAVQPASVDVSFHLTIPRVSVEVGKPLTQSRQLVPRKLLDLVLDVLYAAHRLPSFNGNEKRGRRRQGPLKKGTDSSVRSQARV